LFSYVWRNLFQRKVRTGLSMLGVSVSVAGIVALISVAHGMRASLDTYMADSGASLLVFSRGRADLAFSQVSLEEIERIEKIEGVEEVSRANFDMAMFPKLGEGHKPMPILLCFGRIPGERIMERYGDMLLDGRMPQDPSEILVGTFAAEESSLKVGDRVPLYRKQHLGIAEYEVVGIYESDITWENGGIIIDARVLQDVLGKPDSFNLIFLYTATKNREAVKERIEKEFEHLVAIAPDQFTNRFAAQMEMIDHFVLIVTIIALVVGVLGVLNTMMMSVSERTREIGMLRALGWSRGLVVRVILAEGMLLSVVGGVIGLVLGVLGTEALIAWFPNGFIEALYSTETFVKGMMVAVVVGVLAAIYPAARAANLKPVEALRYE